MVRVSALLRSDRPRTDQSCDECRKDERTDGPAAVNVHVQPPQRAGLSVRTVTDVIGAWTYSSLGQ
jgi:hypothetical protein